MKLNYSFLMSVYYKENPKYLIESIESMLNQTVKPDEIVIIEDGKLTNELEEVIKKYEDEYPSIFNIIRRKENKGLGYSLNEGLKACKNELVARMDSDDICKVERCELQLKRFNECNELVILGTQINEFEDSINNIISHRVVPTNFTDIVTFSHRRSPFNHPTVMYKKSIILENGGYPAINRKEDLKLFIDIVNKNYYCENLSKALLYYRSNEDNFKRRKTWTNCKEYIQIMYGFYNSGVIKFSDLCYVLFGQLTLFLFPNYIGKKISNLFLRDRRIYD